jgi:hypothetical protein
MTYKVNVSKRLHNGSWQQVGDFYTDRLDEAEELCAVINQHSGLFAENTESDEVALI